MRKEGDEAVYTSRTYWVNGYKVFIVIYKYERKLKLKIHAQKEK